ncbi:MAG: SGNH/GDSL hydrolase family protein [Terriglobales bacterium]
MTPRESWAAILACALGLSAAFAQPPTQQQSAPTPFERWRNSRTALYMNDFGELARYRDENTRLKPLAPGEKRVVFFGDSITDAWPLPEYFPRKPYVNRGIGGQTTAQMLVRFRQDVVALQPKVVVILAGTNDIAGNTGPMRIEDIEANFASLAELAKAHGIGVVFSSVLPVHDYTPESQDFFGQRPPEKIVELNRWLKAFCAAGGCVYLDYFSALVDKNGLLAKELADDGLHPNQAGYKVMAPLAERAIGEALGGAK